MDEPKVDAQAQPAWVILKSVYGNRSEMIIEGDPGHVISLIAECFAESPELLLYFEKAHRLYRLHKNKMN